ncbi:hypothetical protein Tco_0740378 [Tanacetum coccineum]
MTATITTPPPSSPRHPTPPHHRSTDTKITTTFTTISPPPQQPRHHHLHRTTTTIIRTPPTPPSPADHFLLTTVRHHHRNQHLRHPHHATTAVPDPPRVERHNPGSKLPNFNTGRILVLESQDVNESLKLTKVSINTKSSKESKSKSQTPLPPLKILQGASPSSEVMPLTYLEHSLRERSGLGNIKHTKLDTQETSSKSVSGPVTDKDT